MTYADDAGNWGPAAQVAARGRALPTRRDVKRPTLSMRVRRGRRAGALRVSWRGRDRSGVACYQVHVRPHRRGAAWRMVRSETRAHRLEYRGRPGSRYDVRVRAIDEAGNVGVFHTVRARAPRRPARRTS